MKNLEIQPESKFWCEYSDHMAYGQGYIYNRMQICLKCYKTIFEKFSPEEVIKWPVLKNPAFFVVGKMISIVGFALTHALLPTASG